MDSYPCSERLDPSDALFVDVIHSAGLWIGMDEAVSSLTGALSAWVLVMGAIGSMEPIDFEPVVLKPTNF